MSRPSPQYNAIDSRHIVVLSKGVWYRMNVTDASRRLMSAYEIQTLLRSIAEDESDPPSAHEAQIAALTTENRSVWAEAREIHFHRGENRTSLDIIERAMFAVILDDNRPETLAEESRLILTGDGTNRWCDKSICAVVFANGRCGLHTEHSWGDAPVIGHMMEVVLANENRDLKQGVYQFDSRGYIDRPAGALGKLLPPTRLQWNIGADLQQVIEAATAQAKANIADLDYTAHTFEDLNKGLITKKCKCGPVLCHTAGLSGGPIGGPIRGPIGGPCGEAYWGAYVGGLCRGLLGGLWGGLLGGLWGGAIGGPIRGPMGGAIGALRGAWGSRRLGHCMFLSRSSRPGGTFLWHVAVLLFDS